MTKSFVHGAATNYFFNIFEQLQENIEAMLVQIYMTEYRVTHRKTV